MKIKALVKYLILIGIMALLAGCSSISDPVFGGTGHRFHGSLHRVSYGQPIINRDPYLISLSKMDPHIILPPEPAPKLSIQSATKAANTEVLSQNAAKLTTLASVSNNVIDSSKDDFWYALCKDFSIDHHEYNNRVQHQIAFYVRHRKHLEVVLNKAAPFLYYVFQEVKARDLPGELTLLPILESDYNPIAYSHAGASGLWQLMPVTASGYGLRHNRYYDGRRDVYASTQAALNFITYLGSFFNEHWLLAIAAYDAGAGTLESSLNKNARRGADTHYWSLYLPHETQVYVPRLLALAIIIQHPDHYGIRLPQVKNSPYFVAVKVNKQINIAKAAKLANTSIEDVKKLNPDFKHNITEPHTSSRLLIPVTHLADFEANFSHYRGEIVTAWHHMEAPFLHYRVRTGDTLASIAHRFKTTIARLEHTNSVRPTALHPNQVLVIPNKSLKSREVLAANEDLKEQIPSGSQTDVEADAIIAAKAVALNEVTTKNPDNATNNVKIVSHTEAETNSHYIIHKGDSIWSIAHKFNVTPADLKHLNHLNSNHLHIGQALTVHALEPQAQNDEPVEKQFVKPHVRHTGKHRAKHHLVKKHRHRIHHKVRHHNAHKHHSHKMHHRTYRGHPMHFKRTSVSLNGPAK